MARPRANFILHSYWQLSHLRKISEQINDICVYTDADNSAICVDTRTAAHWPLQYLHDTASSGPREERQRERKPLKNEKEQFISHMAGITVM
jgi:hypothetical protein